MNTITVAVYMLVMLLPNGGQVQVQDGFTSYEQCAVQMQRINQPGARCIQSGTTTVPLPADVTGQLQKLREYEEKEKAAKK